MNATGIVADHAADRAAVMTGGIGPKREVSVFQQRCEKMVKHHSRLHAGDAAGGIDLENPRHVFGKIKNNGDVAALSGKRCAAAAAEQRRTELAAEGNGCENVVGIARKDDSEGNLAIVGAVGGVESTRAAVEADSALELEAESLG